MSKKVILVAIVLAALFFVVFRMSKKAPVATVVPPVQPIAVTVMRAAESRSLSQRLDFPAEAVGDQEIVLASRVTGTVTQLGIGLGSRVGAGTRVATIDSVGDFSQPGVDGLSSSDTKALDYGVRQAEAALKIAQANYHADKTDANGHARDLAEIQVKAAQSALKGGLDNRFVVAPIAGIVTKRLVATGDSVSLGQPIAAISATGRTLVDFYVSQDERTNFAIGTKVTVASGSTDVPGTVLRMAPEADPTTKRFLVEVSPVGTTPILVGSIVSVSLDVVRTPGAAGSILLPLSAITVGQNESHIFVVENGHAKAVAVTVISVRGDVVEVKADVPGDADIVIGGSRLVTDGSPVTVGK